MDFFALDGRRVRFVMLVARGRLAAPLDKNGAGHRAGNGAGYIADEIFERGHGSGGEIRPGDSHVYVEVGDGAVESAALLLDPFGRADEAFLFGVPTAKDDGAARTPSLKEQSADAADGFKHGGGTAGGIDCAIDPRVAVIADDDPCVRVLRAFDFSDDIPDDAALVILLGDEVNFHSGGTEVIAKRQRTLPALRRARPFKRLQNRRGIVRAEWNGDDARLIAVGAREVLEAGGVGQIEGGGDAGSFRIARVFEEILN